jgi:hypothetical protein
VPASPYDSAFGLDIKKNPVSIATSGKTCKRGNAQGDNMTIFGKCKVLFLIK